MLILRLPPLLLLVLLAVASACAVEAPPPPGDPDLRAELGIADEVVIHRVDLSGDDPRARILPPVTELREGDVVQFLVLDHRVHQVRFLEEHLTSRQRAFLRQSGQDRLPPLLERGARLVLSFEGAPSGPYLFVVEGNAPAVAGALRVHPR